jgi:predicted nucleotidyltransferase
LKAEEQTMDIEELKNKIISTFEPFNPEKIILFGSLARGDWDKVSDIDIIVIYETGKAFLDRMKELYLSWNIPKAVDILAYTPGEFEKMMKESSFVAEAVKEGEVLYERT